MKLPCAMSGCTTAIESTSLRRKLAPADVGLKDAVIVVCAGCREGFEPPDGAKLFAEGPEGALWVLYGRALERVDRF